MARAVMMDVIPDHGRPPSRREVAREGIIVRLAPSTSELDGASGSLVLPVVSAGVGDNWSGGRLEPGSSGTPTPPSTGVVATTPPALVVTGGVVVSLAQPAPIAVNTMVAKAAERAALRRPLGGETVDLRLSVIAVNRLAV